MSARRTATRKRRPRASTRPTPATAPAPDAAALARRYFIYVVIAMVVAAAVLSILAIQRYRDYYGGRFDLGNMTQAVYNTAHGHFLRTTAVDGRQISRLGAHVDPILAAFAIPWFVWPSPLMLLVGQAIIVALAAWPAYRLGLRILGDARVAFFCAVALLIYPPLQYAVLNEFHPVTLAITFLLFAFVFIDEGHWWRAAPFVVLAALCKEEIPLVIAVMGAYFALRKRSLRPLLLTAAAAVYFVIAVKVVLPHYSPGGSPFLNRYADLGSSVGGVGANVFLKPGVTLRHVFAGSDLRYLLSLLWPFGFSSLLSPLTTLIAAPEFALNALAGNGFQRSYQFHYVAGEVPFLFAGAVLGIARARDYFARHGRRTRSASAPVARVSVGALAAVVLSAAVLGNFVLGPLPFSLPGAHYAGKNYAVSGHARVLDLALKMIPSGASVSAENDVGSHLSARPVIYTFPLIDNAQWVVVDDQNPYVYDRADPVGHSQALGALVLNQSYRSVFARDGVYVFKRIGPAPKAAGGAAPTATPRPTASAAAPAGTASATP
jgi:uncharacterized membrane protein